MKPLFVLALFTSASVALSADYLSEAEVRSKCLRQFPRTISCKAVVSGKKHSAKLDLTSLKAAKTNYFEHGVAINGFYQKAGLFGLYPQWLITCNPKTGEFQSLNFIKNMGPGIHIAEPASCD